MHSTAALLAAFYASFFALLRKHTSTMQTYAVCQPLLNVRYKLPRSHSRLLERIALYIDCLTN